MYIDISKLIIGQTYHYPEHKKNDKLLNKKRMKRRVAQYPKVVARDAISNLRILLKSYVITYTPCHPHEGRSHPPPCVIGDNERVTIGNTNLAHAFISVRAKRAIAFVSRAVALPQHRIFLVSAVHSEVDILLPFLLH